MYRTLRIALTLFVPLILSCGGGGGSSGPAGGSPSAVSFNGVAIDGALYRATVFLDLNGNGQLDAGEPTSTTDTSGSYTLSATQDQINSHSVVVLATAGTTIDQDTPGTPMTSNMTMIAPAGNPSVVSPLTTQVAAKMASGMTLAAAKTSVSTELGLTSLDIMKNYVQEKATNPAYADAHKIAASVAEVLKSVDSSSNSNTSLADKLTSITGKVTSQVAPNVTQIKAAASVNDAKVILVTVINNYAAASTFNLAGTISGLTSTGLVLSNGIDNFSPVANSTSFRFPNKLANTDVYEVKIKTQPTGQTCSLTGGFGSINNQSVTSVAVTCIDSPGVLSGSVSGLSTSGLVLKNGNEQKTIPSGATSFTFENSIASGSSYAVTIEANPTGKTCSVSNGAGTMVSAGKSDVQVTCSNNSYIVSGSISGLSVSGLKLSNGGEVKTIASDATTFEFSNTVAYGGGYSVAIHTQPTGYTCSVDNASGIIGSANITSIQITCSANGYSIGGSIAGLITSGLKIKNGDELKTIASGIQSFTFNNKVASGGAYQVTIDTQPQGYTCSVTSETGVISTQDISDVSINCTVNRYLISGIITGTQGLVTINNLSNGDSLIVDKTAYKTGICSGICNPARSFTLTTSVEHGNSYSISLGSLPRGYSCTSKNHTGNATSNVTNVEINCTYTPQIYTTAAAGCPFGSIGTNGWYDSANQFIDKPTLIVGDTLTISSGSCSSGSVFWSSAQTQYGYPNYFTINYEYGSNNKVIITPLKGIGNLEMIFRSVSGSNFISTGLTLSYENP